jgi:hypothetical protein
MGVATNIEDFTKDDFKNDATVQGTITKVNVSIIRNDVSGDWQVGKGATSPLSFSNLAVAGAIAHSALTGLTAGDDHTQYVLLAGRAGGQSIVGGTNATNNLSLESTSDASKGSIILKDPVKVSSLDTLIAGALSIGASTATSIALGNSGAPLTCSSLFTNVRPPVSQVTTYAGAADPAPSLAALVPITVFTNAAVFNYTLPVGSAQYSGVTLVFINASAGAKTILPGAGATIDGNGSLALPNVNNRIQLVYYHAGLIWYSF